MFYKKIFIVVLLLLSCVSWGMTASELDTFKSNVSNVCNGIELQISFAQDVCVSLYNQATSLYNAGKISSSEKQSIQESTDTINFRLNSIYNKQTEIKNSIATLQYVEGSSGGGCNWSTNDVQSVIGGLQLIASDMEEIYNCLDDGDGHGVIFYLQLISQNSSLLANMNGDLGNVKNNVTLIRSQLATMQTDLHDLLILTNTDLGNLYDILFEIAYFYLDGINSYLSTFSSNSALIVNFLGVITYDVGNISTNTTYIVQQLNSLTNRYYSSNLMGYDRFRYYGKPMAGAELQLTNLSPYDNVNNLRNATIYDIISSGFSSSLIAFGSINNYLHFLEQAVVSNNDTRIVAHLGAISNLVHRVDDYVLNDFSNEFHTLAVEIDSWYQGGASNQNQFAISNQLYLSVITQQIDNVSALLQTNNFFLSELTIITNEVGLISTNVSWLVDNIRSLELPVTAEFRGDQDTYYDFLTNYYLSGTANDNPSSNWFERVEVLLAALVFSGNSTTNISDTLSDSSSLSQQVETLIDTIDFSQDSSNTINLSRNVQQSYISFFHSLRNTISSKSNTSTFVLGWGDRDTTTFQDLTSGNFRISISTTDGVFGQFTNIFRSVTTMVWVLFTLFCIYKMGFWLCSRIYSLYSIVRSLIFSLWGK